MQTPEKKEERQAQQKEEKNQQDQKVHSNEGQENSGCYNKLIKLLKPKLTGSCVIVHRLYGNNNPGPVTLVLVDGTWHGQPTYTNNQGQGMCFAPEYWVDMVMFQSERWLAEDCNTVIFVRDDSIVKVIQVE